LSSAVNGPDICRQQARCLPSTGPTKSTSAFIRSPTVANCRLPSTVPTSAVNRPDVCRQQARQNLHRRSLGARPWQIVVCRQRARRLPSTYLTKSTLTFIGSPTVANCCLPLTHPTNQFKQIMQCLLLTDLTSAIDRLDVCCQGARRLPPTCTMSAINWLKICYRSA
jgi:hypothetical protein